MSNFTLTFIGILVYVEVNVSRASSGTLNIVYSDGEVLSEWKVLICV